MHTVESTIYGLKNQIFDVCHIPSCIDLVGDRIIKQDEDPSHIKGDGRSWSVIPDWEDARGLEYNLFSVINASSDTHHKLHKWFKDELIFVEVVDASLGLNKDSSTNDRKWAAHQAEGYFVEDGKLWHMGGATPTRAVPRWECISKAKAFQLAKSEHKKLHMGHDLIWTPLLDKIYSPMLDASITKVITECGHCKGFGRMNLHALLVPITRCRLFELIVGDYLSMPQWEKEGLLR